MIIKSIIWYGYLKETRHTSVKPNIKEKIKKKNFGTLQRKTEKTKEFESRDDQS